MTVFRVMLIKFDPIQALSDVFYEGQILDTEVIVAY